MTVLIDAPADYHEVTDPDRSGLYCGLCPDYRDVTTEPCPDHGPASMLDDRIDYHRLADLAALVMTTREAAGETFYSDLNRRNLNLEHVPLLEQWGVVTPKRFSTWRNVLIHEAHVDTVRSAIIRQRGTIRGASPVAHLVMPSLTMRERQVVELAAEGQQNKQIATTLFLSENTVKTYVRRAMDTLGANCRANLVHLAHEAGVFGGIPRRPSDS